MRAALLQRQPAPAEATDEEQQQQQHEEEMKASNAEEPAALRRALDAAEARMVPWHRYQMNPALGGACGVE